MGTVVGIGGGRKEWGAQAWNVVLTSLGESCGRGAAGGIKAEGSRCPICLLGRPGLPQAWLILGCVFVPIQQW